MGHAFETVEQAGFEVPPAYEGWLYVAGFSPTLPDRINVMSLHMKRNAVLPDRYLAFIIEGPAEFEGEVVTATHLLIAPDDPDLADWLMEQLAIIDRDGILDEETYWPLVDPILQKLWEEATPAARMKLCADAGAPPDQVFSDQVPSGARDILYREIST